MTVHKRVCLQPQGGGGSGGGNNTANSNGGPQELQMSENLIYYSREEGKDARESAQRHLAVDQGKILMSSPGSERVLGEHPAYRSVRALQLERQLLAEGGKGRLNLEGLQAQKEHPGVALQAPQEIRPRPGESPATQKCQRLETSNDKMSSFLLVFHT